MKKIQLSLVIACLCLAMNLSAQTPDASLPSQQFKFTVSREIETKYLVYLPKEYAPGGAQRWPLMLFLHGAGERGTDVQRVSIHGPLKLVRQGTNFPFIIAAPQCADGQRWTRENLLPLLDHLTQSLAVDTNRLYLTGLSMGGYGTWDLGVAQAGRFAAIAPICGGGATIDVLLSGFGRPSNPLVALPIWAFHGAKDPVVPLEESERMIAALKRIGAKNAKLTVYPEAQHDSWSATYGNPAYYDWLLSHSLTNADRGGK